MLCRHKLLLITWPGFLFLVRFNNCDRTMGFYWSLTLAVHSYALLHKAIMTQFPWNTYAKVFQAICHSSSNIIPFFFPPPTDTLHCNLVLYSWRGNLWWAYHTYSVRFFIFHFSPSFSFSSLPSPPPSFSLLHLLTSGVLVQVHSPAALQDSN